MQEAKIKAFLFNDDKSGIKAKTVVDILYTALEDAAQTYFNIENPKQVDYKNFHSRCTKAIEEAYHNLKPYYGWKDFFAKLSLTKISLEITHSDRRGWEFRLFKMPAKKKLNEISELVEELGCATPIL
ncbi:hypothetical protein [Legionella tunisiensis]|uniref:hypothetical protein n=1 Tax=Legionella tunisiensis TaxID=1034944 RepID=UPI00031DF225|nr:hypothetical protein [Legionella tunisiensis]